MEIFFFPGVIAVLVKVDDIPLLSEAEGIDRNTLI